MVQSTEIYNELITCIRTDSKNEQFRFLVRQLDAELSIRDGADHSFYAQFNRIISLKEVVVAFEDGNPVGCGALKAFSEETIEIKRMFVLENERGRGIASLILNNLEDWAQELNCTRCVLETGLKQPEAIGLYIKNGYQVIENYGQYKDVSGSICFEKLLLSKED
jgi:GNAT superfamily N-acetyltransferase